MEIELRDETGADAFTEHSWVETQLAGENRLLEMVASNRSLPDVLVALCAFVKEVAPECECGVYLIDWSGPTFHLGAAPSLPASYTDAVEGLPVRCESAPCGIAALEKRPVISTDLETDPRWFATPYTDLVLRHGLRAVWSSPIFSQSGDVLGTFAVYHRTRAHPSPRLQNLIAQVAHIASIAIERTRVEADLRRSEAFLAEGQRLSLTGTFSWRVDTGAIKWSEQSYRIHQLDPSATVTIDLIRSRIHPDDAALYAAQVEWAIRDAHDFEFECRLLLPDHSVKHVRIVAHATRGHNDHVEYLGAIQDVTERRLTENALGALRLELARVARVSSLGVLTASIAHEVNQPLSGIMTNASTCLRMLASDPANLEGARETVRRTIRDGERASQVIKRLRALFDKAPIALEIVDLNEAIREVITLSSGELQMERIVLRPELSEEFGPLTGDRVQLQQVILNLLRNAVDAMRDIDDRPRQLTIRTERRGDFVCVSVQDAGIGIEPQGCERLFDAFYTTKNDGMGMGLCVSRSIIESHRGRLWATPNAGPGATFTFAIPCSVDVFAEAPSPCPDPFHAVSSDLRTVSAP